MFLSDMIRQLREAAELSQEELARRAGVSVMTVGRLERGEVRRPQRATLERIAEALGESIDYFGSWTASRPKNWYCRKTTA